MTKANKPLQPVSETVKKSVARGWRQGKFGSVGRRGHTSCDVGYASMTGLDLSIINPNGYSTLANGAWAWHCSPNDWFERWVPKPSKGENPVEWAVRIGVLQYFEGLTGVLPDEIAQAATAAINAEFAHLDWIWPPRPRNT